MGDTRTRLTGFVLILALGLGGLVPWGKAVLGSPLLLVSGLTLSAPEAQKGLRLLRVILFTPDAATIVAQQRGFFANEGLSVEVTVTPNSTVQMRGLSQGTWDIAYTAFDNVLAWSGREGAEIIAVAHTDSGIILPLFVRPEIRSWDDLRGRRLAADAVDTAFALVLRRILLEHGLDLDRGDYELVAVGATGARLESMQRGETFAAILSAPFDVQAAAAGFVRLADHREVLPDYPGGVIAVNRAWATQHRDDLVRFLRARQAGARWLEANREAAIDLLAAEMGVGREAAIDRLNQTAIDATLNLPGLQSVLDLRTMFGFTLPMGTDLSRYYDLSYYQAAVGR
ncbi:MAG TPA: ABC transporter substrate-binding protein [Chloroflexota bacterium]|nr:ABC transporter substrate-binding protein [Chloroflexota bacterium]